MNPEETPTAHEGDSALFCQLAMRAMNMPEQLKAEETEIHGRLFQSRKITKEQLRRLTSLLNEQ